ncbi:hypothetical protein LINPERPRIM_LOCUS13247 [Linum perenne]
MSAFLLSKTMTKKMDSMLRNFFWSGSMEKNSIHWCNAKILFSSKGEGGLGFRGSMILMWHSSPSKDGELSLTLMHFGQGS